jgi:hypothetical protein
MSELERFVTMVEETMNSLGKQTALVRKQRDVLYAGLTEVLEFAHTTRQRTTSGGRWCGASYYSRHTRGCDMSEHTPGPWTAENSGLVDTIFATDRLGEVRCIAELIGPHIEANGRLIAAAPELLEACRYVVTNMEEAYGPEVDYPLVQACRDAIRKAEGGAT